jgi:hypothetical protein
LDDCGISLVHFGNAYSEFLRSAKFRFHHLLGRLVGFSAAVILFAYGFKYLGVLPTVLFAITDFSWGVILIIGLQRATGRSHASLLLNRRVGSDQTNSSVAGRDKSGISLNK